MNCHGMHPMHHLYLDGELGEAEAASFAAHLATCRECRMSHRRAREVSDAIRRDLPRHDTPPELRDRIRAGIAPRASRWTELRQLGLGWNPIAIAASVLLAVVTSSAVTSSFVATSPEDRMAEEVIGSHFRSLLPGHLTDVVSSDRHTVRPWFTGKVDLSPPAVDLASANYPLIGGRLDYVEGRTVPALVYRHDQHVINVIVCPRRSEDAAGSEAYTRQGFNLIRTASDDMEFWIVSDLQQAELRDFATRFMEAAAPASL